MFYTYVLKCGDDLLYVGSAVDLRKRITQHRTGKVRSTAHRLPVSLEYYEACRSESKARMRERQLKNWVWARLPQAALKMPARPHRYAKRCGQAFYS